MRETGAVNLTEAYGSFTSPRALCCGGCYASLAIRGEERVLNISLPSFATQFSGEIEQFSYKATKHSFLSKQDIGKPNMTKNQTAQITSVPGHPYGC